jgi:CubicO group peptidase (beta-lactamase class C family)
MARYWPQFSQAGKDRISVRQCLSHVGGLMGYDAEAGMGPAEQFDFERSVHEVEAMAPLWEPGSASMYHFVTFGVLAGELIRRVDGRSPGRFVAEEIVGPLEIDLWLGLPPDQEARRVPHFRTGDELGLEQWRAIMAAAGADVNDRLIRAFLATVVSVEGALAMLNTSRSARAAELPAGNAIGDARALAKIYAALIGRVDGVRLISAGAMEQARTPQTEGLGPPGEFQKLARGEWQPFGLGFELPAAVKPMLGPGSFGHAGAGGRWGFAHPEGAIAVGYVCNTMIESPTAPDPRWVGWLAALREVGGA